MTNDKLESSQQTQRKDLLGSVLEKVTDVESKELWKMDLPENREKANRIIAPKIRKRPELSLPDSIKSQLNEKFQKQIDDWTAEYHSQHDKMRQTEAKINADQNLAVYNLCKNEDSALDEKKHQIHSEQKCTSNASQQKHSKSTEKTAQIKEDPFSFVNYLQNKYKSTKIGDGVKLGEDPLYEVPFHLQKRIKELEYQKQVRESWLQKYGPSHLKIPNTNTISLPKNIYHQFGTELCNQVLHDKHKALTPIYQEENSKKSLNKTATACKRTTPIETQLKKDIPFQPITDFNQMGSILRQNYFLPGHANQKNGEQQSADNQTSYRTVHNGWKVYENRDLDSIDAYRYKSDNLSKWSEARIVDDQVKKEIEILQQERRQANAKPID